MLTALSLLSLAGAAIPPHVYWFDYCQINCNPVGARYKHTLCHGAYPKGGGPKCGDWQFGLSRDVKRLLLDLHNEARQNVASGNVENMSMAADMLMFSWDGECGRIAQRWMDQCYIAPGVHDACRPCEAGPAGQNLFYGTFPDNDTDVAVRAFDQWYHEQFKIFKETGPASNTSDFVQVVFGITHLIGCGMRKKPVSGGQYEYQLACNYFPEALGVRLYTEGQPCRKCPADYGMPKYVCSKVYKAMCARLRDNAYAKYDDDDRVIVDNDPDDEDRIKELIEGSGGGAVSRLAAARLIALALLAELTSR